MSKQAFKRMRKHLKMEVCRKPLDHFAWPGGYPLYYVMADCEAMCPDCVNKEIEIIDRETRAKKSDYPDRDWILVCCDVNYECDSMYCCHCNKDIESAYGSPEDSEGSEGKGS